MANVLQKYQLHLSQIPALFLTCTVSSMYKDNTETSQRYKRLYTQDTQTKTLGFKTLLQFESFNRAAISQKHFPVHTLEISIFRERQPKSSRLHVK